MKKTVLKIYGSILLVGMAYYIWILITDIKIPCFYYLLSGFQCAGCGLTRMCLSLIRLDFRTAISYNAGMFLAINIWNVIALMILIGRPVFVQKKSFLYSAFWITIICLVIWGIVRNFV